MGAHTWGVPDHGAGEQEGVGDVGDEGDGDGEQRALGDGVSRVLQAKCQKIVKIVIKNS